MSRHSLPLEDSLAHVASSLRHRSGNDSSVLLQVDLQNVRKELVNRHNDDDAERSELRRSAELQMLQQEVTPTSEKQRSIESLEGLTAAQLAEHYYYCIKLSAENKINAKNAFSLQLIDYMAMMLKRKDPKMDNFQLASYNLDASTKIYAHRVDCVLADARKMARRLAVGECNIQPERDEGEGRKETKRKDDEDDDYCEELVKMFEEDEDDDYCEELVKPNGVPLPAQLQDVHNAATLDEFAGDNLIAAPPSKEDEDDDYCEEKVRPDGVPLPAQLQDVHNAATLDEFAGDNLIAAPPSKDDEDDDYCEELVKMFEEDEDDDYCEELVKPNGVPLPAQLQDLHNAATLDEFAGDNLIAAPPSKEDEDDDYCEEKVRPDGVPLPAQLQDVHNAATLDEFAGDNLIAAPPSKEDEDDDYCEELVKPNGVPLPAQLQDVHNAATLDEFAGDKLIAAPPSKEDEDDDYCEEKVRPDGVPLPAQLQDVHNAATLDEFAGDNLIAAPPSKSSSPNSRGQDSQFQEEGET